MWLKKLMHDLRIWRGPPIQILCENQGAIKLSKHHIEHARRKHIDAQWHFLKEKIAEGDIALEHCNTKEMIADCMTQAVSRGILPESYNLLSSPLCSFREICLNGLGMARSSHCFLEAADYVGVLECVQTMISNFGRFERSLDR
jgi:hypothetical protein